MHFAPMETRSSRREQRGELKNPEILIRGVSRRRLEDQSRNIRVVVVVDVVGTVGGAIYRRPRGLSARVCRATGRARARAMRFIFFNQ